MAKPCTPQPIAQRVQLFKCQSRNVSLSLGDIKGVFSFAKENTPFAPCSAIGAALPHPWQGKRKSTTTFVVMLYGAGDEARSRHYRAATRTAGDKRPTGAFSRFARALFDPLPARLELASRHPTNRLAAIRRNPASPRIKCACGAGGGSEFFLPNKKQDTQIGCPVCYGAGDEARTRYLHLGKVALYQMSYARGTVSTIADDLRFVKGNLHFLAGTCCKSKGAVINFLIHS